MGVCPIHSIIESTRSRQSSNQTSPKASASSPSSSCPDSFSSSSPALQMAVSWSNTSPSVTREDVNLLESLGRLTTGSASVDGTVGSRAVEVED
ncbi:hypothetical protein ElyMa_003449300 [Elysia marginata]|uniref:Uncharacterized protein n=1 Tax=Elysia marginata TaxID=1093978 RepID=A0AAV4JSK1_9GAST|nr:hypothetical protein ElyMa_003449300 [Elysia marginata]